MSDKRIYEAMFLVDSGSDFEATSQPIRRILERSQAEILSLKPWDDRRLAYQIDGRRRGLYVLSYFRAPPGVIREIEHDCELSEEILRALILRREDFSEQLLHAETPATQAEKAPRQEAPAQASEGEEGRERPRGRRSRGRGESGRRRPASEGESSDRPERGERPAKGEPPPQAEQAQQPPQGEPAAPGDPQAAPGPDAADSQETSENK